MKKDQNQKEGKIYWQQIKMTKKRKETQMQFGVFFLVELLRESEELFVELLLRLVEHSPHSQK